MGKIRDMVSELVFFFHLSKSFAILSLNKVVLKIDHQ